MLSQNGEYSCMVHAYALQKLCSFSLSMMKKEQQKERKKKQRETIRYKEQWLHFLSPLHLVHIIFLLPNTANHLSLSDKNKQFKSSQPFTVSAFFLHFFSIILFINTISFTMPFEKIHMGEAIPRFILNFDFSLHKFYSVKWFTCSQDAVGNCIEQTSTVRCEFIDRKALPKLQKKKTNRNAKI